ncbi:hypothetical protein AVEN_100434-1 [Araneus ventricosus]|uniref:Uncharacterized protein n=1 Tax=Araneus ventricosus TaxID=182803 RepID=A0A4Y2D1U1_ARAVE|nr:hypothetical protein AVEN_100434-1 [Araneus ventricosus]
MVCAAFEAGGGTEMILVENKMNSVLYKYILPGSFVPVIPLIAQQTGYFNKSMHQMHIPCSTKSCMKSNERKTNQWPSRRYDLNLMEDLRSILFQDVYKNGKTVQKRLI